MFSVKRLIPNMSHAKLKDKSRTGRGGVVSPGDSGQDGFFGPATAPNSFKRALNSLRDLMELPVVSPDSGVSRVVQAKNHLVTRVTLSFMKQPGMQEMLSEPLAM